MTLNPDALRRVAYACIDWLTLTALVWGGGWLMVTVWNLRMGV